MKPISPIILLLIIITAVSCQKADPGKLFSFKNTDTKPLEAAYFEQRVCFSYSYENHAWGYQQQGWFLDSSGFVHSYGKDANIIKPQQGHISGTDLLANLEQCTSAVKRVDKAELLKQTRLIPAAAKAALSEDQWVMADAGSCILNAYYYNNITNEYQVVLLKQRGDLFKENLSPEAKLVSQYLEKIGAQTDNFICFDELD